MMRNWFLLHYFRLSVGVFFFAGVLAACGNGERAGPERPDHAEPALDMYSLPVWTLEEEFRIGSVEDPDVGFTRVGEIAVGPDGTLVVLESQDRQIRAYDTDGKPLWRVGRRGSGPGEFQGTHDFGLIGDTIWVVDQNLRRITFFDFDGELLGTTLVYPGHVMVQIDGVRTDYPQGLVPYLPTRPLPDGTTLWESVYRTLPFRPGVEQVNIPLLSIDSRGEIRDTVGYRKGYPTSDFVEVGGRQERLRPAHNDTARLWLAGPGADDVLIVELPDQVLDADGRATTRFVRIKDGDTVFARTVSYVPRINTEEEQLERQAGRFVREGMPARRAMSMLREALPLYPEVIPPVSFEGFVPGDAPIRVADAVWLRRWDERARGEGVPSPRRLVVDLSVGPVALVDDGPRGRWMASHDGERFWGVDMDREGFLFLVRYRVNREPTH